MLFTPERVPLVLREAGLGERALAYVVDVSIVLGLALAAAFVFNFFADVTALALVVQIAFVLALVAAALAYDVISETLFDGRTPGKRLLAIRVVTASGAAPDLATSLTRNVLRLVDFMPGGYGVGAIALFLTGARRLGDLVAGTHVVLERAADKDALMELRALAKDGDATERRLTDDDARLLVGQLSATRHLAPVARDARLAAFVRARALVDDEVPPARAVATAARAVLARAELSHGFMRELFVVEEAREALASALAAHARAPTIATADAVDGAIRHAGVTLLRARARDVPDAQLTTLSLALLRAERLRRTRARPRDSLTKVLTERVPRAIYDERALVARAAAVLFGAAATGYFLARGDELVARALLGDDVAGAIDDGARWTDRIEQTGAFLETAVRVTLNNVRVGLLAFAAGAFFGVGTLVVLVMNGLHLGAVFGFAARHDQAEALARFVLAHGPVELFSICLAGAAGLVIGRALVAPGDRRRRDALVEDGRRAFHLLIGATMGFCVIGGVEGFVSPGATFSPLANAALGLSLLALALSAITVLGGRRRVE